MFKTLVGSIPRQWVRDGGAGHGQQVSFLGHVLPMPLLSHRPWAGAAAEWSEHPTEAVSTGTQRPAIASTPSRCPTHRRSCAWALGAGTAACPRATVSGPAAATEAEPHQPHPETARSRPRGDPAGARVQVLLVIKPCNHQGQGLTDVLHGAVS